MEKSAESHEVLAEGVPEARKRASGLGNTRGGVSFPEALEQVLSTVQPIGKELSFLHHALNRPVAEDLRSPFSVPPVRNSAVDGYALPDDGSRRDGYLPEADFPPETGQPRTGITRRVLTGQDVPEWTNCVAAEEHCVVRGKLVFPRSQYSSGSNVREAGEDTRAGDLLVSEGTVLDPTLLARLASAGFAKVPVSRRPRVLVLTTGNEIARSPSLPKTGIPRFESDSALLAGLLADEGAVPLVLPHLPDDPGRISRALACLPAFDLFVSCGGAANSEADLIRPLLAKHGASFLFERVRMKPGRPTGFGKWNGKPVFCLPGNPVAVFIGFLALVRPALRRMNGRRPAPRFAFEARLEEALPPDDSRTLFHRVRVSASGSVLEARPYPDTGSGLIRSLTDSDGIIVSPPGSVLKKGDTAPLFWWKPFNDA